MKISFLLPGLIKIPVGGVKIIYRYAGELQKLGHEMAIISPKSEGYHLRNLLKAGAIHLRDKWHGVEDKPYYQAPEGVKQLIIPAPDPKFIPDGDVLIATAWQTAFWVADMPPEKGEKFYYIQNLETYLGNAELIRSTWKLPLKKIVIAQWLLKTAEEMDEKAYGPVPIALDPEEFPLERPISSRPKRITMLFHRLPIKGGNEGIEVLERVKETHPQLEAIVFASRKPRASLPEWVELRIRPDITQLKDIYNSTAIFLHTSHQEGWGMPPMEAMACGCAVVAADNKGVQEFITDGETGLLRPIGDTEALVKAVQVLLNDNELRIRLAVAGHKTVQQFTWGKSVKWFNRILIGE
ncbi:MAG: glycosyltransferase family 4 protein [Fidelibacterota bacterium]